STDSSTNHSSTFFDGLFNEPFQFQVLPAHLEYVRCGYVVAVLNGDIKIRYAGAGIITAKLPDGYFVAFNSRFISEFSIEGVLGAGNFGCVLKARNIYDEYIDDDFNSKLKEVRTMAQLHHTGIVRYHGTWS
ncbi:hypothetical protein PENTCL1PPCAC_8619, partial [Pristionchus entomophagus]